MAGTSTKHLRLRCALAAVLFCAATASPVFAQQPQAQDSPETTLPAAPQHAPNESRTGQAKPERTQQPSSSLAPTTHRFWDRENDLLFAAVGAGRAFDYASTLNLRHRGLNEVFLTNAIVDNHPLFAGIEAAATVASVGVSYAFHRTGHHKLERWTSIIHFGVATVGAIRNYALPTPH
jgi:hypothetical protein